MHIGSKVKIRDLENYTWDESIPSLAPGSVGRVIEMWQHPWRRDDKWWIVRLKDGDYPFYESEIMEIWK